MTQGVLPLMEEPALSADEAAVLSVLRRHRGRAAAIPLTDLSLGLGIFPRTVQQHIVKLIEHGEPIGSATDPPHGFFLIESLSEQLSAERQLERRIISLARRLARLRKNTPNEVLGQLMLADVEENDSRPVGPDADKSFTQRTP